MGQWTRAVVVGASSGIGAELAKQLAAVGTDVVLVSRREDVLNKMANRMNASPTSGRAEVVVCDVRNIDAGRQAFATIVGESPIDLLIYSSGVIPPGSADGFPTHEDVVAIETNFTGAVVWLNAATEYFVKRGGGTIVGISSVAGDRGRQGNPVYNATKAGLSTYLEALRNRVAKRGVKVVTAKPGFISTPMLKGRRTFPPAAPPDMAARHILRAAAKGRRVAYIPPWWWAVALILKLVPAPLMERLSI